MKLPVLVQNDKVIVSVEIGPVDHADLMETFDFLADHFSPCRNKKTLIIIDRGSDYNPLKKQMRQYIDMIGRLHESAFSRIALVVSKLFHYGLGRMAEGLVDARRGQFRVFKDEKEAHDWLSV